MATPEQHIDGATGEPVPSENLDPRHFYAAYVFEYAALRGRDVAVLVDHARRSECLTRRIPHVVPEAIPRDRREEKPKRKQSGILHSAFHIQHSLF